MVNHVMRHRIQELIDGAPADPSDDQAIGVWLARIQALLIGRGSIIQSLCLWQPFDVLSTTFAWALFAP